MKNIKNFISKVSVIALSVGLLAFSPVSAASHSGGSDAVQNSHITEITVKKGDTLYSLSRKYNTTVSNLMALNNLSSYTIYMGQTLVVSEEAPLYKVIAGSFKDKNNAQTKVNYLKDQGIDAFITEKTLEDENYYRVQVGAFHHKGNAYLMLMEMQNRGIDVFIDQALR